MFTYNFILFISIYLLSVNTICFAEEKSILKYPYGGELNKEDRREWMTRHPLLFSDGIQFLHNEFEDTAYFAGAKFNKNVDFTGSSFTFAQFYYAKFNSSSVFRQTSFNENANFSDCVFEGSANFSLAKFYKKLNFSATVFEQNITFYNAHCYSGQYANFNSSIIAKTIVIGGDSLNNMQKYDFRLTHLNDNSKIILKGPANLKLQLEKFKFLHLSNNLDYFSKKLIIDILKQTNFKGDNFKKERFELNYIFAGSTVSQKISKKNELYFFFHPRRILNNLYLLTMGLGYRPYRLFLIGILIILLFSVIYFFRMSVRISNFIENLSNDLEKIESKKNRSNFLKGLDSFITCMYFSSIVFLSIKIKKETILYFNIEEKIVIFSEWFLGLAIYLSFITLSKSGSILYSIKSLFLE